MLNYDKYLESEILGIINSDLDKKIKFEKSLEGHIKMCQGNFASTEINNFINALNTEFAEKYPSLNQRFLTRTEKSIDAGGTPVFMFDKDKDQTENFIVFLQQKNEIVNQIQSNVSDKINSIEGLYDFLNKEVYPYIKQNPDIINNPFYREVKRFEFSAKYVQERVNGVPYRPSVDTEAKKILKLMVTFSYNGTYQNPFEIQYQENMSQNEKDRLKYRLTSCLKNVLVDSEKNKLKEIDKKLPQLMFLTKVQTSIMPKWSEPKLYWFNSHTKTLYVSVLYLNNIEENEKVLRATSKNLYKILKAFKNYPAILRRDLVLTNDPNITETYSFEKKAMYIRFDAESEEFKNLSLELNKQIEEIIRFDEYNIVPNNDFILLRRYHIQKVDNFDINENRYTIYKFRGKKNKTYFRGFKNGNPLSTYQLTKLYRKRKQEKSQA